jgi:hypothetical protein
MAIVDIVRDAILDVSSLQETSSGVRVTTHCMYPSNSLVSVYVNGGNNTFVVSDDGNAIKELTASGIDLQQSTKAISNYALMLGVAYKNGSLYTPQVSLKELSIAIILVANSSKELATHLLSNTKIKNKRNFKELVHQFLSNKFDLDKVKPMKFIGESNKPHKFDNVIVLNNERKLIVDPVIKDAASINARVVANIDIKSKKLTGIEQRIIYDDEDDWTPSDINLLTIGATVIPFSKADLALQQFMYSR